MRQKLFTISIGVCVYNEEMNIRNLLVSLLNQRTTKRIKEIIVVSSACSDKTDEIIENEFLRYYPEIILIKQGRREGKASAINLFLERATGDIMVLESGDTIPAEDTIENLTEPFLDKKIGMTGGRPIPVNDKSTFMGFTVHLLWNLHHKLALKSPKLGELVAFRNDLINKIPIDTAVDEATIEALIKKQEYELKYVPNAVVFNKGPESISDFLIQRRRIFAGHIDLKKKNGYATSSMKKITLLKLAIKEVNFTPKEILWTSGAMLLEFYGRLLGSYDFYIKKDNPFIWNTAGTTKNILEKSERYDTNQIPDISAIQRIKLWSMVEKQTSQKSRILPDETILPDRLASSQKVPELSKISSLFDLERALEEKMEELEDEKNIRNNP